MIDRLVGFINKRQQQLFAKNRALEAELAAVKRRLFKVTQTNEWVCRSVDEKVSKAKMYCGVGTRTQILAELDKIEGMTAEVLGEVAVIVSGEDD